MQVGKSVWRLMLMRKRGGLVALRLLVLSCLLLVRVMFPSPRMASPASCPRIDISPVHDSAMLLFPTNLLHLHSKSPAAHFFQ